MRFSRKFNLSLGPIFRELATSESFLRQAVYFYQKNSENKVDPIRMDIGLLYVGLVVGFLGYTTDGEL